MKELSRLKFAQSPLIVKMYEIPAIAGALIFKRSLAIRLIAQDCANSLNCGTSSCSSNPIALISLPMINFDLLLTGITLTGALSYKRFMNRIFTS